MLAARHTDTVAQDKREGGFGSLPGTANSCGSQQAELAITRQTVGVSPFGGGGPVRRHIQRLQFFRLLEIVTQLMARAALFVGVLV